MALLIDQLLEGSGTPLEENGNGRGKAFQQKRLQEGQPWFGAKKGRAAFADITNLQRDVIADGPLAAVKDVSVFKRETVSIPGHDSVSQRARGDTSAVPVFWEPCIEEETYERGTTQLQQATSNSKGGSSCMEVDVTPPKDAARLDLRHADQAMAHDIDADDFDDPLACPAFAEDIMDALFHSEALKHRRPRNYVSSIQTDITAAMRGILVDWLVDVSSEYKVHTETLFLTVAYIDRFLSVQPCSRKKLQLLGVTCMLVAAKHEEIYAPLVADFCQVTDSTYTREEVLEMERILLDTLSWELTQPTIMSFLRRFVKAATFHLDPALSKRLEPLSEYLAVLTLIDYSSLAWRPSDVAASAVALARLTLGLEPWTATLELATRTGISELWPCLKRIHQLHLQAWSSMNVRDGPPGAIRAKYSSAAYRSVSMAVVPLPRIGSDENFDAA